MLIHFLPDRLPVNWRLPLICKSHFLPLHTQPFAITYDFNNNKIFGLVRQTRLYAIRKDRYWTDQPTYSLLDILQTILARWRVAQIS